MKALNIIKTANGGYSFTATREDGNTVFGILTEKDLSNITNIVDTSKNLDEQRMESLNLCINSLLKLEKNKKAILTLVERWQVCSYYPLGHYVTYNDKLYLSRKAHNSTYENIPANDRELWFEVEIGNSSDYEQWWKSAEFWAADKTYKKGDMVIYYNKLYRSLKDNNVSNPEKSDWELIEKDK
jgi:hypothetical protein|nr:MAG TPA: Chitin oligosaccharide deacetylase [Caudoviricetes sp.]